MKISKNNFSYLFGFFISFLSFLYLTYSTINIGYSSFTSKNYIVILIIPIILIPTILSLIFSYILILYIDKMIIRLNKDILIEDYQNYFRDYFQTKVVEFKIFKFLKNLLSGLLLLNAGICFLIGYFSKDNLILLGFSIFAILFFIFGIYSFNSTNSKV